MKIQAFIDGETRRLKMDITLYTPYACTDCFSRDFGRYKLPRITNRRRKSTGPRRMGRRSQPLALLSIVVQIPTLDPVSSIEIFFSSRKKKFFFSLSQSPEKPLTSLGRHSIDLLVNSSVSRE